MKEWKKKKDSTKRRKNKMDTDAIIGAAVGLAALGVTAHVAGHMMRPYRQRRMKRKVRKIKWM